jgi:pimeloyl-ACP methyl ester carboxylesterase
MAGLASAAVSIVLVHGAFADGSGWQPVYKSLKADGYDVSIVQEPNLSLEGDVAATKWVIAEQTKPVVLVGHSYGGAVITEAGNDPKVAALVYIAAWVPAKGESVGDLLKTLPPDVVGPPILPPRDGFLLVDRTKFPAAFAGDVDPEIGRFMADSQIPWNVAAAGGANIQPAWASKPSWYMVTTEDRMIPPVTQRSMSKRARSTVVEVAGSHAVFVSHPQVVAKLIETAADAVASKPH